ncbi:MAG: SUMF1/EgtB/PvdO family nonheme iron enzyme [Terriglobia bacterium]
MLATQTKPTLELELLRRLAEARSQTDEIFELVRPDSIYERPIPERHRIVFYLGHIEAFDWNLLHKRMLNSRSFLPAFDRLFAFGIDPVGGQLPSDHPTDWPSLSEIHHYNRRVRETLDKGLQKALLSSPVPGDAAASMLLNVAIEHRLMHAETLAYILHQMPFDRKTRGSGRSESTGGAVGLDEMVEVPAGLATLGLPREEGGAFGWDNEYEVHRVSVPRFAIDRYKVTNGQYLKFMAAGGYEDASLWSKSGWNWKTGRAIAHPVFWKKAGGRWLYRGMFDEYPLPLDCPAQVSFAEASAYARWAGKSLPSEAQWQRAAYGSPEGPERLYPWGVEAPSPKRGNFDFQNWDPAPVGAFPHGRSAFGVAGLIGDGWEWTRTTFGPFPGFQPFSFYPGYSADFFDGKHYVLKGASARTAACMVRRSFRNWFQPHYQYLYACFRCVKN